MRDLRFYRGAIDDLARSAEAEAAVNETAKVVRDRAKRSAGVVSTQRAEGIVAESGRDFEGAYADVGYDRTHFGFVLFWHEVGTSQISPTPHLRSALRPID